MGANTASDLAKMEGNDLVIKIYESTIQSIDKELIDVSEKFPRCFNSRHEGFAVLKEEVDELWDDIRANKPPEALYNEAKQIAAMAIKFMQECCTGGD